MATNYLSAPIEWNVGAWHQIVLTYSATNSALYLDGQPATNGPGVTCWPGADALTNGFFIGSDPTGEAQMHGVMDDLEILAYPLDADTISNDYAAVLPEVPAPPVVDGGGGIGRHGGGFAMDVSIDPGNEDDSGDDGSGEGSGTNALFFTWPVYLTNLTLLDPADVPTNGVFYLYQDQVDGNAPVPYPFNPCSNCPVYSLPVDGYFLVDDSNLTRSEAESLNNGNGTAIIYGSADLWLQITNISGGNVNLILHGSHPGQNYELLSAPAPAGAGWTWTGELNGASNANWTAVSVPVGNRSSQFYRAWINPTFWLQLLPPGTNAITSDTNSIAFILHNAIPDTAYDILSKQTLRDAAWNVEMSLLGVAGQTSISNAVSLTGQTSLFLMARNASLDSMDIGIPDWWQLQYFGYVGIDPYGDPDHDGWNNLQEYRNKTNPTVPNGPLITWQPLSQTVSIFDTATFTVVAEGPSPFGYQWQFAGTNLDGETNASLTLPNVQMAQAGNYSVRIGDGLGYSALNSNALLTVEAGNESIWCIVVSGPRQDYTFRRGVTYEIDSTVQLYGNTTLEGLAVLKFNTDNADSSLVVLGSLTCPAEPYAPAILTTMHDDSAGECFGLDCGDPLYSCAAGAAYLDLSAASNGVVRNLRVVCANQGITTPAATGRLDVWDCQFVWCNTGIVNQAAGGAVDSLHNVLFAGCGAAIGASSNSFTIEAEQITADVTNFWVAPVPPDRISLTNSIVQGVFSGASEVDTQNAVVNPLGAVFQTVDNGNYYLAAGSPLHQAGTTNISPQLLAKLGNKTTCPPAGLPAMQQISGDLVLFPRAPRYTGGAPDLGYHYDALDYTVANLALAGGTLTVEPGTAVAVRHDLAYWDDYDCIWTWTVAGILVQQGSAVISHGTPTRTNLFTVERLVQETPETACSYLAILLASSCHDV